MISGTFLYKFSVLLKCGLSTSAGNLLNCFSFFAVCNNRPVRVICCAGKWPEIAVYKQEDKQGHCDSMLCSLSSLGGLVKLFFILFSEDSTQNKLGLTLA